jgi:tetratricopeptide (TPR) repeat protein
MNASRWIALFVVLLGSRIASFAAAPSNASFDAANKLYEQGKYGEAVPAYEALRSGGLTSPALLYNLGNARFKSGRIGKALGAYLAAGHLAPRDPDIRANLQFARKQVQGPTLAANSLHAWLSRLTLNEWSAAAAGSLWLLFAQLIVVQLWPAAKASLRPWSLSTAGLALLLIAGAGTAYSLENSGRYAVVTAPKVSAHSSPFEGSDKTFDLQDGAEVQILDEKEDWVQATTDARRTGWIQKRDVEMLVMRP